MRAVEVVVTVELTKAVVSGAVVRAVDIVVAIELITAVMLYESWCW